MAGEAKAAPSARGTGLRGRIGLGLRRAAVRVENALAALRPRDPRPPVIEPYAGYATPQTVVLRGRVLSALRRNDPKDGQSRWRNALQMLSLFLTREVADVAVIAEGGAGAGAVGAAARSDEEGYFTLSLPRPATAAPGWVSHRLRVDGSGAESHVEADALVVGETAPFLVISDIDDTVLRTGAYSLARNLWTSLTGNARSREVFEDAASLLRDAAALGAPIYYVSSSPWNLHHFLASLFAARGVPRGPMFLRDYGLSERKFIVSGHGTHKSAAVDAVLAANPRLQAILLGDTGQKDAEIYAEAAAKWPDRVRAVALRRAGTAPPPEAFARFAEMGVPAAIARDFAEARETLGVRGAAPPPRPAGPALA